MCSPARVPCGNPFDRCVLGTYDSGVGLLFTVIGIAFAATSTWLTVRCINRREKWAQRTVVALVLGLAYPLSFGPACWLAGSRIIPMGPTRIVFWPLVQLASHPDASCARWYAEVCSDDLFIIFHLRGAQHAPGDLVFNLEDLVDSSASG